MIEKAQRKCFRHRRCQEREYHNQQCLPLQFTFVLEHEVGRIFCYLLLQPDGDEQAIGDRAIYKSLSAGDAATAATHRHVATDDSRLRDDKSNSIRLQILQ